MAEPIPGFTEPVKFNSTSIGQILTMVDRGNFGDPSTGEQLSVGDAMAGYAPRIPASDVISSYPDGLYDFMNFNGIQSVGIALNVQGLNFSSGAPWYNATGELTHLSVAATNGTWWWADCLIRTK
ncbi:MAG: hypothetical protein IPK83_05865 [Planctomycetes bacterium]|nr:hypothetical protein [Planctomycetota bacterium]